MNTLQKAERLLIDANARLLELADEIGQGRRIDMNADTVMQIVAISQELGKAAALLFASDEVDTGRLMLH